MSSILYNFSTSATSDHKEVEGGVVMSHEMVGLTILQKLLNQ